MLAYENGRGYEAYFLGFSTRTDICYICYTTSGWVREKDPSRLLHYEGGGARTLSTDIVCPMYARVWNIVEIANDPTELRPVILCECVCTNPIMFLPLLFL